MQEPTDLLRRWGPIALVVVGTAVACLFVDPISRDDSHYGRLVLAAVAIGLIGLQWGAMRVGTPAAKTGIRALLAAACTVGWFNYYQFEGDRVSGIGDHTDIAYYYTNSKYLAELSYFGLYAAALVADEERGSPRTGHIVQYRDLRDYELKRRPVALEHGRQLRDEVFTPQRWAAFSHDMTFFLDRIDKRMLERNFFVDHGYNPPPTWTVVGGNIANLVPVEYIGVITHLDTALVATMFGCIAWAFGFETMAFAMLFFVSTFSGRWPMLGTSLMRFDWLAMLVISVCLLKKNLHAGGGAAMAYAGLNRIFPSIFFLGWGLRFLQDTFLERRVLPRHQRFIAGAGAMSVAMVGIGLVLYGPSTYSASGHNLLMHNRSYSSHRVGLGDVIMYRGETTRKQINANCGPIEGHGRVCGIYYKELSLHDWQWPLRGIGLLFMAFIAAYIWRNRDEPDWSLIHFAILPFWAMTNAQINYWNLRLLLYVWHGRNLDKPIHRLFMAMLFAVEVVTQYTKVAELDRYTTTTSTSIGMAIYFVALGAWMALQIVAPLPADEKLEAETP